MFFGKSGTDRAATQLHTIRTGSLHWPVNDLNSEINKFKLKNQYNKQCEFRSSFFWALLGGIRRFGTACWPHLQRSKSQLHLCKRLKNRNMILGLQWMLLGCYKIS